jgi:alginate O-acetyltransferase complex protein AlgI
MQRRTAPGAQAGALRIGSMLFNSLQFLIFFPVVTVLYFLFPHRHRWWMLLIASCVFYMSFIPKYIVILAVTIMIDYVAGIMLEKPGLPVRKRKGILTVSILSTCLVLFIFKYFNFFNSNFARIAALLDWNYPIAALKIALPIGLSFHTFQSLSYVIEVYRGHQKAERHFGIYSLYVMFYPQLVAGPIERPQNLLHQFYAEHAFDYRQVTDGLKLMVWGLFKKVVIADRLAVAVTTVYGAPREFTGLPLIVATIFFAFQIYCDFSGYSDIAIGAAQVMGFRLMDNFNRPYFSKSIAEFWKRWHISLSTWFRDYLYIPLGGNRVKTWRWQLNLFVTFLVSGFWHGANWTYVIWGALHGFYLMCSIWTRQWRQSLCRLTRLDRHPMVHKCVRVGITFCLACVAWIFFRAKSVRDAWYILTHLGGAQRGSGLTGAAQLERMGLPLNDLVIAAGAIAMMECVHAIQRHRGIRHMLAERPIWLRWTVYYSLVLGILFFGVFKERTFIYFQF